MSRVPDRSPTSTILRQRLDEAKAAGLTFAEVSVLSERRDPYRLDTPAMHRDGAWLRDQKERLGLRDPIHLRGFHYVLVAAGDVLKPDGKPYVSDEESWISGSMRSPRRPPAGSVTSGSTRSSTTATTRPPSTSRSRRSPVGDPYGIDVALPDTEEWCPPSASKGSQGASGTASSWPARRRAWRPCWTRSPAATAPNWSCRPAK